MKYLFLIIIALTSLPEPSLANSNEHNVSNLESSPFWIYAVFLLLFSLMSSLVTKRIFPAVIGLIFVFFLASLGFSHDSPGIVFIAALPLYLLTMVGAFKLEDWVHSDEQIQVTANIERLHQRRQNEDITLESTIEPIDVDREDEAPSMGAKRKVKL